MHESASLITFDHDNIGNEFARIGTVGLEESSRHNLRRSQILQEEWRSSFSESSRIPKSALQATCSFDTRRANTDALMTWGVTILLSAVAGVLIAFVIRHLNL